MRLIAAVLTGVLLTGGALAEEKKYEAYIKFCPKAAVDCIKVSAPELYDSMESCVVGAGNLAEERVIIATVAGLYGIPLDWSTHCVPVGPEERKA